MSEHYSTDRMNDALDGLLTSVEMERLSAHVDVCGECREEYARTSETVEAIRALPKAATAPADAWAGIAARLEGEVEDLAQEADVIAFPTAVQRRRRLSFSIPQAVAAVLVISVLSAGTVWMAMSGGAAVAAPGGLAAGSLDGPAARAVSTEIAGNRYEQVVGDLEAILDQGRAVLSPETLLVIEQSLGTVNEAIAEVESALSTDPASDMLARMLVNHQRTKLGVLQRAADAVRAQT